MSTTGTLFSLEGKTAIVTGALGLLGQEHCRALSAAGARVVVADIDRNACDAFARTMRTELVCEAMGVELDVTSAEAVLKARDTVLKKWPSIDVLINNAAINDKFDGTVSKASQSRFEEYSLDLWKETLDMNVTGVFLCSQVFGGVMTAQGSGSIVNVASPYGVAALDPSLHQKPDGTQTFYKTAAYPTAKGAVLSFTRFLAAYWGSAGVRVNALSPGGVENGQDRDFVVRYANRTPLGRMARRSDYRGAIQFLASDASAYMTGANLIVDGGWTVW
jgi:NAD(P)-dependent dehydrogenase (short-subunit alcohol dehydrogenase family)